MLRSDVLVAALFVLFTGWAVWAQLGSPDEDPVGRMDLAAVLDVDQVVTWIGDPPFRDTLSGYLGARATVFMTWSVPCPCVEKTEARLRAVARRFPAEAGVAWIAVDGEPYDTAVQVREKMGQIESFYPVILDPNQRLTGRFGHDQASQIAVFDASHRLVYRGPFDQDYEQGAADLLADVLTRLLAPGGDGDALIPMERDPGYGCFFNDPSSCQDYIKAEEDKVIDR